MSRSRRVKGMVSLGEHTYRIERLEVGQYAVMRVTDDVRVGTFKTGHKVRVLAEAIDATLLEAIARAAVQTGKTSWAFHATPSPPPSVSREQAEQVEEAPISSRRRLAPA